MHPKFSGSGGNWQVFNESIDSTVIKQQSRLSCGAACGEMLLKSRGMDQITQSDIETLAGAPTWPELLANVLNQLAPSSQGQWMGNFVTEGSFHALMTTGSWVAVFWDGYAKIGHMIVVDAMDNDMILIRDPWDGTKYSMTKANFLSYWNAQVVYWAEL